MKFKQIFKKSNLSVSAVFLKLRAGTQDGLQTTFLGHHQEEEHFCFFSHAGMLRSHSACFPQELTKLYVDIV